MLNNNVYVKKTLNLFIKHKKMDRYLNFLAGDF